MADYSTTALLNSIKRRCLVPSSQITLSDTDFLSIADEELQLHVVPLLKAVREEYFVTYQDVSVAANTAGYALPDRAIGAQLRDVTIIDTNTSTDSIRNVPRIDIAEIPYQGINLTQTGYVQSFYLQNNYIYFLPTPSTSQGTIRLWYFLKPNRLVALASVGVIAGIDTVNKTVTLNAVPSTFAIGTSCDFIKSKPGFDMLAMDQAITGISSTTISFAALPSTLLVGDYLSLARESAVPQIPEELHPLLAQRVAVKALEAIGDNEKMLIAAKKTEEMEMAANKLMASRVEGEAKKIKNSSGLLGVFSRSQWGY